MIINSKSTRSPLLADDLLYVSKRHDDIRPYVLEHIEDLDPALDDIERGGSNTLILAGGDGTMQAAITSAINKRRFQNHPNYVALPCGMTNVIANDCGLQGPPATSLDNFLWRRGRGEVSRVERPLIGMQLSEQQDPIYGFFLGAGLFHKAVQFSREKVQKIGAKRSLAVGISTFSFVFQELFDDHQGPAPLPTQFRDEDGELIDRDLSIILMTTLNKLSAGIFPFWGGGKAPMNIMAVDYPRNKLLWAAMNIFTGRHPEWLPDAGFHSWKSDELRLRFDGPVVFDGEIFHTNPKEDLILKVSEKAAFLV
ncbi:diacylglycerol kinase family protein [Hyphococcus flavus]|uniref:Diacylglycerol kinase family protein n=1 Tax=Hyphococcus flavus TaxID=1866326 RepID=A0AAE9ZIB9_9PROT|nr:diacylglycerol kinase family protein [Hyphococcus flavus]WDI31476.1 diacylglycerol kinase family protein [Hyphococcus flavus]